MEFAGFLGTGPGANQAVAAVKFVISSRAEADLLAIHSCFSERSSAVADRIIARLFQRFDELCEFPFLGPDRSELRPSLRGSVADGYVAF
jgi:toxin ParE1/3/4